MTEITRADTWDEVRAAHRWDLPADYNLAWDMCEKWARADPDRLALINVGPESIREWTFRDLSRASARLANVFAAHGVTRGERVGILLPQVPETILCHLACYRLGAVALPLFTLFGEDGLSFRIGDSGARAVVTNAANLPKLSGIRDGLPSLKSVFSADGPCDGALGLPDEMARAKDTGEIARTGPDDPAFICYTSGTTGPPKGALHGHRVLLGHVPGVQLFYDFWPQPGDRIWTPSDWAWLGGLGNVAMPALRFGVPLIAHAPARFDPERAFALIREQNVTNAFLAPTALKLMRQAKVPSDLPLRSIGSGGESLGAAMLDWGRDTLGLTINEFYGQTECNLVLGNNARILPVKHGSMGKPIPGSRVTILDEAGAEVPPGTVGEIAIHREDAAMFLTYWNQPEKAAEKFVGDWMRTGDEGSMDEDGYFHFASRTDDVITSSGYRIGPVEIEECLARHPAVAMAACIGVPDPVRTETVKAFVVLADGRNGAPELADELKAHVKTRLSPHVTPREIVWIDEMPVTATGKILRRTLRDQG